MATEYPTKRSNSGSDYNAPRGGQPRPAGARPAGSRPTGYRPAGQRPAGQRPAGARPSGQAARRPAPRRRRRKPQGRFYALIAVVLVLLVALILIIAKPFGRHAGPALNPNVDPAPTAIPDETSQPVSSDHADALAALLGSQDQQVASLSADQMVHVEDLSVTPGLPEEWLNILLLGSDERTLSESARTDSMIICSINRNTGEVKLTSIMRDLAVDLNDIGQYSNTYRINAANYFGGENLAMKVVNEHFGMNIQNYVHVNFYGFQQVAEMLGGIEMDITEDEMNMINELIVQQFTLAARQGIDESALKNEFLETYGPSTHLDGRQTLAYARIRKLDGGDYARAERQRNVLVALMNKLDGAGAAELLNLGMSCMPHFRTNLSLDDILSVATTVCGSGMNDVKSFRLPINNSYVQETRNEQSMLYDCDWSSNARELYNFIYG